MLIPGLKTQQHHYTFSWRSGHHVELLVNGEVFYPEMFKAIEHACSFICLEIYLCDSGTVTRQLISALRQAQARQVNIYLLIDNYGARQLNQHDRNQLDQVCTQVIFFNPFKITQPVRSLIRDHRKLLLIDNRVAFIGGAGFTDEFIDTDNQPGWHDIMLEIHGPVINDLYQIFLQLWNTHATIQLANDVPESPVITDEPGRAHLLCSQGGQHHEIIRAITHHIFQAKHRIWFTSPYFVSTRKLRSALEKAAQKGIDVRLLLPGDKSDHPWVSHAVRRFYHRFLRAGVRVYEYQPRFTHAKIFICDDWITLGSSNLDRWDMYWNLDANVEFIDDKLARQCQQLFEADFLQSKEILHADWQQRSLLQKLKEWSASYLVYWLEKFSRNFRRKAGSY